MSKVTRKSGPGRPSKYSQKVADAICQRLATGETLRSICRDPAMPQAPTVRHWAMEDREGFFAQYARARDLGLDAMADELFDIADDGTNDWMERHGQGNVGYVLNGENVGRSRLRVDTRKWYLSKLAPKRYGEKIQVEERTELSEATDEELRAAIGKRLRQMKDKGIDVQALLDTAEEEAA